jgi:phosphomannomutase
MIGHLFHPSILRQYDIRGVVDETLKPEDAFAVGRCFGTLVCDQGGTRVSVGYDGRLSSPNFESSLVEGLIKSGLEVMRIGLCSTPTLYFSEIHAQADGAIMVTGSHNPPEYNGFKMSLRRRSFFGKDIKAFAKLAETGAFVAGKGFSWDQDVIEAYCDHIIKDFEIVYGHGRPLRVAWDCGSGSTVPAIKLLTSRLPGEHILINDSVDGTFPSHHPDPVVPENLKQLQEVVERDACDFGVAFDGDGDRLGVIDNSGAIIWGDELLMFYAREVLSHNPGSTIIADVKASQILFDEVKRMGGSPIMWRTGHSLIKHKMVETQAPLAGEMSGHIFFADRYFGFDDAIYAAVRLLGITSTMLEGLSQWHQGLPKLFNTPELRFKCEESRKFEIVDEIKRRIKKSSAQLIDIDGIRVITNHGWWLLRASNTQNDLVARIEAQDEKSLQCLKDDLIDNLAQSGIVVNF